LRPANCPGTRPSLSLVVDAFPADAHGRYLGHNSFAIIFIVFKENSYAASVVKPKKSKRVISTGLYAYVRHPMYAGAALLLIATPLALGSWSGIPVGLVLCAVVVVRLFDEERRLAADLPGYEEYCRNVPYRIVPGVW
jgi:protein-S-isoprenylcysteine O-methyltransferase Ste14